MREHGVRAWVVASWDKDREFALKIGIGTAFVLALVFHGALLATLAINVSLDKPKRPEERAGQIMHATIVPVPPAKGNPQGKLPDESTKVEVPAPAAEDKAKAEAEAAAKQKAEELAKEVAAQKKAEAERQKAIALKKKAEEEAKKKAEAEAKAKAEAEAKAKAEAEAKAKAEAEAKAKAEAEAKAKAEAEAKAKAEAEAKRKEEEARRLIEEEIRKAQAEEEAKRKAAEEQAKKAQQQAQAANSLEDELLGQVNGSPEGEGLGVGTGSNDSLTYGAKVQQLIEQNWRIDPSMNGKRVVVTVTVDDEGMISNEKCSGDKAVCASAIATLHLIGMLPMPPKGCKDCNTIVITMTPKV